MDRATKWTSTTCHQVITTSYIVYQAIKLRIADGTQFRSKWKVVEYMEAAGSYLQEEIEWVRASITTPRPEAIILLPKERTDKLKREWKDDDPTVPPGWKVAWTTTSDNRSKIAFMSPDKKIFHSRKAALQHMMAAGTYDPEDIVKMTKGLNVLLNVGDEWKEGKVSSSSPLARLNLP